MDDESPLLVDTGRGLAIYHRGRHLYSETQPRESAEQRARSAEIGDKALLFIPSPLLFYGIEVLLERLPPDCHLLCVEADQQLMALSLRTVAPTLLQSPRISFVRTDNPQTVARVVQDLGRQRFRRCHEIRLSGGYSTAPSAYRNMFEAAEREIQSQWRNRLTLIEMSNRWIKNLLLNLPLLSRSADFSLLSSAAPVIVAGAGDSLEEAIPRILEVRAGTVLIAVDTALPILSAFGIEPDAILILESQFANLYDFIGLTGTQSSVLADLTSYPPVLRNLTGPRFLFVSDFARPSLLARLESAGLLPTRIPALGSVGVAATYCALRITTAPVLLAGLDFSFIPGKMHARGAASNRLALAAWNRTAPPPVFARAGGRVRVSTVDKRGRQVASDPVMSSYRFSLTQVVSGERRVFDLSTRGVDLGLPQVLDASALLKADKSINYAREGSPAPLFAAGTLPYSADSVSRFLKNEDRLLEEATDRIERTLSGKKAASIEDDLTAIDYVYLHFPDHGPHSAKEASFLRRVIESADTFRRWIAVALSTMESG